MLEIVPVTGIGDITPGTDLAAVIADAAPWLADGDVVVVTSKIVSKAEGRLVEIPTDGPEREAAREEVLAAETARLVAQRGPTRIVQTHHGFVMASAGVDASNVKRGQLVLLPKDPDASARALRAALRERCRVDVAVVISDTMGRPWRVGQVDVALGVAGLDPLRDYRGTHDAYGNELHVTQMAVADELCAAAELVKGKADRVPVAVIRGLGVPSGAPDGPGAAVLVRAAEQDLFFLGTAEARAQGLLAAACLTDSPASTVPSTMDYVAAPGSLRYDPGYDPGVSVKVSTAVVGSTTDHMVDAAGSATDHTVAAIGSAADHMVDAMRAATGQAPDAIHFVIDRALDVIRSVIAPTSVFTVAGATIHCAVTEPGDDALIALGTDVHRLRAALLAASATTTWRRYDGMADGRRQDSGATGGGGARRVGVLTVSIPLEA